MTYNGYTEQELDEVLELAGAPGAEVRAFTDTHPDWRERLRALDLMLSGSTIEA